MAESWMFPPFSRWHSVLGDGHNSISAHFKTAGQLKRGCGRSDAFYLSKGCCFTSISCVCCCAMKFFEPRLHLFRLISCEITACSFVDSGLRPQGKMQQHRNRLDSDHVLEVAQTVGCHLSNV